MILLAGAALIALACAAASAERVRKVLSVAHFELVPAVALDEAPPASFEADLREALREVPGEPRAAAVEHAIFEAEFSLSRWRLVPRTAARISSSSAFLLAAAQLREVLARVGDGPPGAFPVIEAVQIVAAGLAGTTLCLSLGRVADRAHRDETARIDAFASAGNFSVARESKGG